MKTGILSHLYIKIMKTLINIVAITSISIMNLFGQPGKLNKDTSGVRVSPLYVVKLLDGPTSTTSVSVLRFIDPQHIEAMEIYKETKYVEQYGEKAKNGLIIITLKKEAPIKTYDEVLDFYKIATRYRRLPLYIDSNLTANDGNTFLSANKLKSVKVAREKGTGMKYISIITDYVPVKPDPTVYQDPR